MANGYGGGGSSGSSGSSSSSGSNTSLDVGGFLKIKDGVEAPKGFHYMPNGKLMRDSAMKKKPASTKKKPIRRSGY